MVIGEGSSQPYIRGCSLLILSRKKLCRTSLKMWPPMDVRTLPTFSNDMMENSLLQNKQSLLDHHCQSFKTDSDRDIMASLKAKILSLPDFKINLQ